MVSSDGAEKLVDKSIDLCSVCSKTVRDCSLVAVGESVHSMFPYPVLGVEG